MRSRVTLQQTEPLSRAGEQVQATPILEQGPLGVVTQWTAMHTGVG